MKRMLAVALLLLSVASAALADGSGQKATTRNRDGHQAAWRQRLGLTKLLSKTGSGCDNLLPAL